MLALCIYVTSLAVSFHQFRAGETLAMFVDGSFGSGLVRRASAAGERIVHPRWTGLIAQREAALAAIRDQNPLPPVSGTVDIYPWNAAVPLAYGMDYVPRPMFQSYQVYGTPLITLNRRHLQSERAASTLIFDVETIDNRFPALDEGELWPDLIAHYDPAGVANGHLLLRRRATPRDVEMQTLSEMRVGWSDPVAVPPDEAPIWTTIRIDKTLFGRLFYVLFKAPPMGVLLTLGNGQQRLHRLVPDAVRYGFVLSPIVDTGVQFEQLIRGDPALRDPGQRVMSFRLVGPPDVTSFYRGSLDVTFQRLFFEHFTGH
jgi:hypothetical protein